MTDEQINTKYEQGQQRILTEINREKLPSFADSLKKPNYMDVELNELIIYSNDAAHGALIDNFLGFNALLELCDFVESICQALADLLTDKVVKQKEIIGKAKKNWQNHRIVSKITSRSC